MNPKAEKNCARVSSWIHIHGCHSFESVLFILVSKNNLNVISFNIKCLYEI